MVNTDVKSSKSCWARGLIGAGIGLLIYSSITYATLGYVCILCVYLVPAFLAIGTFMLIRHRIRCRKEQNSTKTTTQKEV